MKELKKTFFRPTILLETFGTSGKAERLARKASNHSQTLANHWLTISLTFFRPFGGKRQSRALGQKEAKTSTYLKFFLRPVGSKRQSRAPYMEELNRRIAETANSSHLLVSRDTRWSVYRLAHRQNLKNLYH